MNFRRKYIIMLPVGVTALLLLLTLNLFDIGTSIQNKDDTEEMSINNDQELNILEGKIFPAYVFANSDGDKLITFIDNKDIPELQNVSHVISNNGVFQVNYLEYQESKASYNYRETMYEFDDMPGHIFSIVDGEVLPNETCLLINENYFPLGTILNINSQNNSEMSSELLSSIEDKRNRNIENGWILANGDSWEVGLVQFEREENDMLASIILIKNEEFIFKDYSAQYDEQSTWRLEDYGEIDPIMFKINFVAKDNDGYLLSVSWSSYESESVFLLKEENGQLIDLNIGSGRYISPM